MIRISSERSNLAGLVARRACLKIKGCDVVRGGSQFVLIAGMSISFVGW